MADPICNVEPHKTIQSDVLDRTEAQGQEKDSNEEIGSQGHTGNKARRLIRFDCIDIVLKVYLNFFAFR